MKYLMVIHLKTTWLIYQVLICAADFHVGRMAIIEMFFTIPILFIDSIKRQASMSVVFFSDEYNRQSHIGDLHSCKKLVLGFVSLPVEPTFAECFLRRSAHHKLLRQHLQNYHSPCHLCHIAQRFADGRERSLYRDPCRDYPAKQPVSLHAGRIGIPVRYD